MQPRSCYLSSMPGKLVVLGPGRETGTGTQHVSVRSETFGDQPNRPSGDACCPRLTTSRQRYPGSLSGSNCTPRPKTGLLPPVLPHSEPKME